MEPQQQKAAACTVVFFVILVLIAMNLSLGNSQEGITSGHETNIVPTGIKEKQAANPKRIRNYGTCNIQPANVPDHPIQSTFTASYPGSGAKMTWKLIEAMTGLVTGDDFQLNGHENIVSIKTHYPSNEGRPLPGADSIPRAILLIRDPLYSIPSYYNFIYEYQNGLAGHSVRAPLEEWIKWRNDNFDRQMQVWRRHTEYWMDTYQSVNRLVVPYEKLTDDDLGADMAISIADFLNRSDGVQSRPTGEIPCIWHSIVKYKDLRPNVDSAVKDVESKRAGPKYIAPFNHDQLRDMMNVLTNVLEKYMNDEAINAVLISYIDEVARRAQGPPEDENTVVK
jgi:hypothetical protein